MVGSIRYCEETKKEVISRVTGTEKESVIKVAKEKNINKATIYNWIKDAETEEAVKISRSNEKWRSEDKFHMVLETASLTEQEISEYCRRKGIYTEDLKAWEVQCMNANNSSVEDPKILKAELKEEKDKNRRIEKELRFKEKDLAETAALLVLRKNVHAIWGGQEEE
jgi:transposase